MEEINASCNEINPVPKSENNETVYLNEVVINPTFDENNVKKQPLSKAKVKQESSRKLNLKLLFTFLCVVAVLHLGIYVPVLSKLFSPIPKPSIIETKPKVYLSDVKVDFKGGSINVKLKADDSFSGFGTLLVQVKNITDSTWGPLKNGIDWTTVNEADLSTSKFVFPVAKSKVDQYFEVRIYCITKDSGKKALPDTITTGDPPDLEYYYLIYTYDKPLVLKGV